MEYTKRSGVPEWLYGPRLVLPEPVGAQTSRLPPPLNAAPAGAR
jgi:hypothetical protein